MQAVPIEELVALMRRLDQDSRRQLEEVALMRQLKPVAAPAVPGEALSVLSVLRSGADGA